jgi:hypothetical protein
LQLPGVASNAPPKAGAVLGALSKIERSKKIYTEDHKGLKAVPRK